MLQIRTQCAVLTLFTVASVIGISGCELPQRQIEHVDGVEVTVTDQNFQQEVLESDEPVLVDFWATWCGPCREMEPVVATLSNDFEGRAKVAKLDVDQSPNMAAKYQVDAIPRFFVFKDGKVAGRIEGTASYRELAELLEQSIDQPADAKEK
ncbi:MAG: thioredoxin [Planctomycetaceae bacterium]|nr:thioredoxin [Planctomycetaceae bacterium]